MTTSQSQYFVPKQIAVQVIDGEFLLLPDAGDASEIWLLADSAAAVFSRLAGGESIQSIANDAADAVRLNADVLAEQIASFAATLVEGGILSEGIGKPLNISVGSAPDWPAIWRPPVVTSREPITVMAGFCTLAPASCRGRGQRPVRSAV